MNRTLRFRAGDVARFVIARSRESGKYRNEVAAIELVGPFVPGQPVVAAGQAGRWTYAADYLIAFADGAVFGVSEYQLVPLGPPPDCDVVVDEEPAEVEA